MPKIHSIFYIDDIQIMYLDAMFHRSPHYKTEKKTLIKKHLKKSLRKKHLNFCLIKKHLSMYFRKQGTAYMSRLSHGSRAEPNFQIFVLVINRLMC